jgi:protein-tyrosine phosphatase
LAYIDIHLHLLPGVDDGARSLDDALRHARRLATDGIHEVLVTPHVGHPWFDVDVQSLPERTSDLQRAIDREGIALQLHAGGELHPTRAAELPADDLELVAQGPPGSRWVLLEVPFAGLDERFLETAAAVQARGYGLVIAHPERAVGVLREGMILLCRLLESGVVLQVNVCSLLGLHGPEAREAGEYLLRTRVAYLIASDGHPGAREHTVRLGFDLARRAGVSALQARRLTQSNPRFLLEHGMPRLPLAVAK